MTTTTQIGSGTDAPAAGRGRDTLRVGVVGLGFAGETHTRSYGEVPGVEVIALAGLEADRLAALGEKYTVPNLHADWEALLARDDLDVVSVCVPNFLHAPVTIRALETGRHVLCEKPLARTAAEAEAMVAAAVENGRVLHTAFNHRERGDIAVLKEFIDAGKLGRVYQAKASWMRYNGIPGQGSWFTNKNMSGGGPLIDLGVHVLDQALYLMGEPEVQSISAATYAEFGPRGRGYRTGRSNKMHVGSEYEVEDLASAFIRMTDGSTLLLEAGWSVFGDYADDFSITLYGTEGGATMSVKSYGWEDTVRVYTETAGSPSVIIPTLVRGGGHQAVVNKFIEAIRSDEWSVHVGREGLLRTRVVDACYTSAREGREVMLAE